MADYRIPLDSAATSGIFGAEKNQRFQLICGFMFPSSSDAKRLEKPGGNRQISAFSWTDHHMP